MLRQVLCVLILTSFALVNIQIARAEIDITDRAVTDPLIKIQTLESVERKTLDAPRWQTFQIPFDHEPVVVKNFANGWMGEYAFLTYSISKAP